MRCAHQRLDFEDPGLVLGLRISSGSHLVRQRLPERSEEFVRRWWSWNRGRWAGARAKSSLFAFRGPTIEPRSLCLAAGLTTTSSAPTEVVLSGLLLLTTVALNKCLRRSCPFRAFRVPSTDSSSFSSFSPKSLLMVHHTIKTSCAAH